MKSKTKMGGKSNREQLYPAYYLAIVLSAMLLLEGLLLGAATPHAWEEGLEVLDISAGVELVMSDMAEVVSPMMDQVAYVAEFYRLAAVEMESLLDLSDHDVLAFPKSVNEFYRLASIEMAELLDFSDHLSYIPQVAGASISR
jgi:hypothetical protein